MKIENWNKAAEADWLRGTLGDAWRYMGAHPGEEGTDFALWAPGARSVRVSGDFCGWGEGLALERSFGGLWRGFSGAAREGCSYKYIITGADGTERWKADPFGFAAELRPGTASVAAAPRHRWSDGDWMEKRRALGGPLNIYELHAGSWRRREDGSFLSWCELGDELIPYIADMGFTHIELLPVMEHPLDASWGYQLTGFFAATARHGDPSGLMAFIDRCHRAGIGVILDWVPGHFCRDGQGLAELDGTPLYEGLDHPQWGTYQFDFSKGWVRSFLLSSALWWLGEFHADGLRVDGVSSMLYLNFGRDDWPEKRKNKNGGGEDLDAIAFLQELNRSIGERLPGAFTVAEESSAWPLVTYPPEDGGLGFHYKWDMGWMNDTLRYMETDFDWRPGQHRLLNFSMVYAFSENFILPLSHDEVVHGKKSLIGRMPGDWWRQFAGMRLLRLYALCHPGGKLLFMGGEFAQFIEWREYEALEWFLLSYDTHRKYQDFVRTANRFYRQEKALWELDRGWEGFQWLDADDGEESLLAFIRRAGDGEEILCVLHFGVATLKKWRLGVPRPGLYGELLSTDAPVFGGSGKCNPGPLPSEPIACHGQEQSIEITVPPIGGTLIKLIEEKDAHDEGRV